MLEYLLGACRLSLVSRVLAKFVVCAPQSRLRAKKIAFHEISTNQNVALRTTALFLPTDLIGFGHEFMVEEAYREFHFRRESMEKKADGQIEIKASATISEGKMQEAGVRRELMAAQ